MERVTGIEPALKAWEALILPLNYTRVRQVYLYYHPAKMQQKNCLCAHFF